VWDRRADGDVLIKRYASPLPPAPASPIQPRRASETAERSLAAKDQTVGQAMSATSVSLRSESSSLVIRANNSVPSNGVKRRWYRDANGRGARHVRFADEAHCRNHVGDGGLDRRTRCRRDSRGVHSGRLRVVRMVQLLGAQLDVR
jgi:hypothetical protein